MHAHVGSEELLPLNIEAMHLEELSCRTKGSEQCQYYPLLRTWDQLRYHGFDETLDCNHFQPVSISPGVSV